MFMPAARLGLHYYKGGIRRYVTRLGVDNAKKLFLTAQKIAAAEMLAIGYLTATAPEAALDAEVDRLATILAGNAPSAMRGMKLPTRNFACAWRNAAARSSPYSRAVRSNLTSDLLHRKKCRPRGKTPTSAGEALGLDGAAVAIQTQRFASSMINVVAADEFGTIVDGTPGEALKFLRGVTMTCDAGEARNVSINGVPSGYACECRTISPNLQVTVPLDDAFPMPDIFLRGKSVVERHGDLKI
eukprot:gene57446-78701_t